MTRLRDLFWFTTAGSCIVPSNVLASLNVWRFGIIMHTFGIRLLLGRWGRWCFPELVIWFPWCLWWRRRNKP